MSIFVCRAHFIYHSSFMVYIYTVKLIFAIRAPTLVSFPTRTRLGNPAKGNEEMGFARSDVEEEKGKGEDGRCIGVFHPSWRSRLARGLSDGWVGFAGRGKGEWSHCCMRWSGPLRRCLVGLYTLPLRTIIHMCGRPLILVPPFITALSGRKGRKKPRREPTEPGGGRGETFVHRRWHYL